MCFFLSILTIDFIWAGDEHHGTQALVAMRIQQLCAEHGYNLNQLARSCGVPPSTVKNIIHGASHNPGIVTIKLLCDGLGISLYDFFNTDDFRQHEQELK